uniref:Uncharacterized protein n=1 Tax=Ciona savignyi TaxID=51511 RepID=H2ZCZ4_CIOSA
MKKHSPEDSWFHNDELLQCVADLFLAGTDTSSNTISWAVSVLLHFPDLQTKLFEEISSKTGEKPPAVEHRQELPLLQAFIQEILRCFTIAPLSLQHKTSADVEIGGCFIPKHTLILTNLYAAHHDPKTWKDPTTFNIYRHIDKDGKFVPSKKVISFGIGARSCLGEKLGRIEIFLFLANIIKTFEILPDPKSNRLPSIDRGIAGFLYIPYPFKVVMKSRI